MKKYIIIFIVLTSFISISANVFADGFTLTKVALKYQGEDTYRIYDISPVTITWVSRDPNAESDPFFIVVFSDGTNDFIDGTITEIKFYQSHAEFPGWLDFASQEYDVEGGFNFLPDGYQLELSSDSRKRITLRCYATSPEMDDPVVAADPIGENL